MAPSGSKKALSLEAVMLASQKRVQQRSRLEPRFGEQHEIFGVTKISSEDRILQRTGDQTLEQSTTALGCAGWESSWRKRRRRCLRAGPDTVILEQIAVRIRVLSWLIFEAVMTSSQDQNLQRTVEQGVGDKLYEAMLHVSEKNCGDTAAYSGADLVEVDKATPQERVSGRMGEPCPRSRTRMSRWSKLLRRSGFLIGVKLSKCPRPTLSLRSEFLNRWANRAGVSKCPKSHAGKVSRQSTVSLRSSVRRR